MTTAHDVRYPQNMVRAAERHTTNWAESTLRTLVDCVEDYARVKPLSFAVWTFGIGFALGWKLKPW
jgi:hypothetical protein